MTRNAHKHFFYCSKRIQIGATAPGSAAHDEYRLKEGYYADEGSKNGVHLNERIRVHPAIDPRVQASHQQDVQDQAQSPSQTDQPPASIAIHGKAAVKKLSVLLPAELHRRARRHALLHDKTLTTLIIELLSEVLDDADTQPPLR